MYSYLTFNQTKTMSKSATKVEAKEDEKVNDNKELSFTSEKIAEIADLGQTRSTFTILFMASLICVLVFLSSPQYCDWSLRYMGYQKSKDSLNPYTVYALTSYICGGFTFLSFVAYKLLQNPPKIRSDMEVAQQLDHLLNFMKLRSSFFITLLLLFSSILVVVASPQYGKMVLDTLGQEVCQRKTTDLLPKKKNLAQTASDL